jgi:hypothetical protein
MHWLTDLLGVNAPENTTLHAAEVGFRGLFVWWLVGPMIALLAAFIVLLYFRERGKLGPVRRVILSVLRVTLLAFLILLMCRPVLLAEFKGDRPRSIVLLFDNSQSMKQMDRRMSFQDQGRVAIAQGLAEPGTDLAQFASLADIPPNTSRDPARIELVKAILTNPKFELLEGLKKHGPLRPFLFGEKLYSVVEEVSDNKESKLAAQLEKLLNASQEKTALANHILEILNRKDGDLPAAIVLVTDGLANADHVSLAQAAKECADHQVPLYIYGVGSTEGGILQITDLHMPPTVLYEDKIAIPLTWRAQGFKEGTVQITMALVTEESINGKKVIHKDVIDKKEIPVRNGDGLHEDLLLIPKLTKLQKNAENKLVFTIELKDNPHLKGEVVKDEVAQSVYLSDKKLKVLYVENTPRWEYLFLQPLLVREEQQGRIDANFILIQSDAERLKQHPFLPAFPPREELFKYDLIILGDVPSKYLGKNNMDLIEEYVRQFRGGLVVIAGDTNMPSSYENSPIADVLPVEFLAKQYPADANAPRPVEYQPVLTKAGETSGMLDLTGAEPDSKDPKKKEHIKKRNVDIWKNLPGFFWHYDMLTRLKPGATSLLVHPRRRMDKEPMPILAMHYYGKGQVLFLATDEIWRWRKDEENKYVSQFWGQIIYQLALPHHLGDASKRVTMMLEQSEAILNRKGYIYATLRDDKFLPILQEQVAAKLTHLNPKAGVPKTEDVVFKPVDPKNRPGEYKFLAPHDQDGRFEIKLKSSGAEHAFQYQVKLPPRHELEEAPLAEDILSQAAKLSGGAYYREEDLHRLPTNVQPQKTSFTLHQEILLWNPLVFLIFIGLITTEWIVRKFSNLS